MNLSEAAQVIGARRVGSDAFFSGLSTDSRTINAGELFCALSGPNFDGLDHCDEVARKGAVGAIVERETNRIAAELCVPDTRQALAQLARAWRERFALPLIGVTGSNGKTTVKEMIAAILRQNALVLATEGNLNNEIGVPKTLFGLAAEHDYAVIEMGASRAGDIALLADIAQPQVGVITLCAPAHLEGFGSIEGVAAAKGELFSGLAADGTAVINADDSFRDFWRALCGERRIIEFGQASSQVFAKASRNIGIGLGMRFELHLLGEKCEIELPLDGEHNVANALAAAAVAHALDIPIEQIKTGLEATPGVAGRLQVSRGRGGCQLINDTYNANPRSLVAALSVLATAAGERWLVLGNMGELGKDAQSFHTQIGSDLRRFGVSRLFTIGDLAQKTSAAFGDDAQHFDDIEALNSVLIEDVRASVTVLVKGSRVMRMERVIDALSEVKSAC